MKKLFILLSAVVLAGGQTGCANQAAFFAGQKVVVDVAAQVADENLAVATFSICKAITVGAWLRAYGSDPARAEAWRTLCATPVTQTPAKIGP